MPRNGAGTLARLALAWARVAFRAHGRSPSGCDPISAPVRSPDMVRASRVDLRHDHMLAVVVMQELTFARPSDRPTAFAVGAPAERLFRTRVAECAAFFRPLLAVDIGLISPQWSGRLHFVYYEPYAELTSRFRVVDGAYEYKGDFSEVDKGSRLRGGAWKFRFVDPVKVQVPRRTDLFLVHPSIERLALNIWKGDPSWKPEIDNFRYWKTVERAAQATDPALTNKVRFGGEPEWVQNDETPTGAGGELMTFIGQVQADVFTENACGITLYLFYDANRGIAVQVGQIT
jgi:hypothetical protein